MEWVTDTLPFPDEYVLVTCRTKAGKLSVLRAYHDGRRWCGNLMSDVVAWMPMPAPYEGER